MRSSVIRDIRPRNGDIQESFNTHSEMDVMDAAYHCVHDYPGGVPSLAPRVGMNANTLMNKVALNNSTHHLSLREATTIQAATKDTRIVAAMARTLGGVFISLDTDTQHSTMEQVMHMAKEFGDVLQAVNDAVSDGRVTRNEMLACERQAAELQAALNGVLAVVRGLMPEQKGGEA